MKKKNFFTITAIAACLALAGGLFYSNHQNIALANKKENISTQEEFSSNLGEVNQSIDISQYNQYEQFGLKYDKTNERFYYNGKLVRYFKDVINADGITIGFSYSDGEVDLIVKRSISYKLEGIEVDKNFDQRTKEIAKNQKALNGATSYEEGTPVKDGSLEIYENYGIKYEKDLNLWSYDGRIIHTLYDENYQTYLSNKEEAKKSNLSLIVNRNDNEEILSISEMDTALYNKLFK